MSVPNICDSGIRGDVGKGVGADADDGGVNLVVDASVGADDAEVGPVVNAGVGAGVDAGAEAMDAAIGVLAVDGDLGADV